MAFDALLGNERLKERLSAVFGADKATHCYLITGPQGSGRGVLAELLMAALECESRPRPCCRCSGCRKVLNHTHPDIVTVDDDEHKSIPVKMVREACSDLYIRPNEGNRKIYFFPHAEKLNRFGQNTLLKCIEEPPAYGAFVFVCEHPEQMLPTIRSRSVELRMAPLSPNILEAELRRRFPQAAKEQISSAAACSSGYLGQAVAAMKQEEALSPQTAAFLNACCIGSPRALLSALVPLEKLKREAMQEFLREWYALLSDALSLHHSQSYARPEVRKLSASCSEEVLLSDLKALHEAQTMLDCNVGTAHICGALAVQLQQS